MIKEEKVMKRLVLIPLMVVLAAVLVFTGCAQQAAPAPGQATVLNPAPAPQGPQTITAQTQAPAPSAPAAKPGKIYYLKFNDWGPSAITIGKLHIQAAEMIEERTGGKVIVTNYFNQSLLKYGDTFRGISAGIADLSLYVIGATQGVHDINQAIALPFMGLPDMPSGTKIYNELRQKFPELDRENTKANAKWLTVRMMPPTQLHLVKRFAALPDDLKGMKVIAGASLVDMLSQVGAAGVMMGPPDWYMSLERGLVEGQFVHWPAVYDFHTLELFKFHTLYGDGGIQMSPIGFMANLDSWNQIPAEYQKIIVDVYQWVNDESTTADLDLIDKAVKAARDWGHISDYLTPEEIQLWAKLVEPYHQSWIADATAKGWPAQQVYDGLKQIVAKY
ncbi:MAG: hypothetical protein A2Z05_02300 [Chloroflexi bacterium RBG_16_60_22]|nr:MAG: hypothetical protein A2Z05_02300 [Chloroflexi bacterium RBG_16_60_22]